MKTHLTDRRRNSLPALADSSRSLSALSFASAFLLLSWVGCSGDRGGSAQVGQSDSGGSQISPDAGHAGASGSNGSAGADASPGGSGGADARPGVDADLDAGPGPYCNAIDPPTFTPGPELSDSALGESFAAIAAILKGRTVAASLPIDSLAIRAAVHGAPHVAAAGIGEDCTVLVRLSDGTPLSIYHEDRSPDADKPPFDDAGADAEPPAQLDPEARERSLADVAAASNAVATPESAVARIGDIENFAANALPEVYTALNKRGYEVRVGMTSADLRTGVKNLAVLWLATHSTFKCIDRSGAAHWCLVTEEVVDGTFQPTCALKASPTLSQDQVAIQCALNRADVHAQGRASYAISSSGAPVRYAINEEWVRAYWTFAKNSVVFLDACSSMWLTPGIPSFRSAVADRGAGTVLGWTGLVNANFAERTARFLFDRVLGANAYQKLTPPQRPFSVPEVFAAMEARNKTLDPNNRGCGTGSCRPLGGPLATKLAVQQHTSEDTILVPSIRNMTIGDPTTTSNEQKTDTELHVFGQFGTQPGSVTIDGVPGRVKTWESSRIVVLIDTQAKGPVEVKAGVGPFPGNQVPLTSWRGTFRVRWINPTTLWGPPGPHSVAEWSGLHFRTDVHRFRLAPEEEAHAGTVNAAGERSPRIRIRNATADSKCSIETGGSSVQGNVHYVFEARRVDVPWLPLPLTGQPGGWWAAFEGSFDASTTRLTLGGGGFAPDVKVTRREPNYPDEISDASLTPACVGTFPVNASTFGAMGGPVSVPQQFGISCEYEYDLMPEAGSAPTENTPG